MAGGRALAETLKEGAFTDASKKLGTNIAPFLGLLTPMASIILAFIPGADSAELIFMREKFEEDNVKLDIITAEFTEVKNAIDWSTVVVSYGTRRGRSERQKRIPTEFTVFNARHARTKKKMLLSNTRVTLTTAFRNSMMSSLTMIKSFRPW